MAPFWAVPGLLELFITLVLFYDVDILYDLSQQSGELFHDDESN